MYFDSLEALLYMDGHGGFVWSAYLIAIAVVAVLLLSPGYRRRRFLHRLSGEIRRREGRAGPGRAGPGGERGEHS